MGCWTGLLMQACRLSCLLTRNVLHDLSRISSLHRKNWPKRPNLRIALTNCSNSPALLSSPWNLWNSGQLTLQRTVLKLAFAERITYCRKTGLRTPETTLPFKVLRGFDGQQCLMAGRQGFEPWERSHVQRFSRPPHSTTLPPPRSAGGLRRRRATRKRKLPPPAILSVLPPPAPTKLAKIGKRRAGCCPSPSFYNRRWGTGFS